jgi:hypothetical protein
MSVQIYTGSPEALLIRHGRKTPAPAATSIHNKSASRAPLGLLARKNKIWLWGVGVLLVVTPLFYFVPRHSARPLAFDLREESGLLLVYWTVPTDGIVTILDGPEKTFVPVNAAQTTMTYARRSGDVTIELGPARVRFVGPPAPLPEIEQVRASVQDLQQRIASLRNAQVSGRMRLAALESLPKTSH